MISPISPFLAEFRPLSHSDALLLPPPASRAAIEAEDDGRAAERLTAQIAAARRAGADEAHREAAEAREQALAALEATHATRLADERQKWVQSEAMALAVALAEGLTALEDSLAQGLTDVLAPLLPKLAAGKAVDDLRGAIATLLADDDERSIRISGPADLIGALRSACADMPGVTFASTDSVEVTVQAGETRIETQLALWATALDAALGADR